MVSRAHRRRASRDGEGMTSIGRPDGEQRLRRGPAEGAGLAGRPRERRGARMRESSRRPRATRTRRQGRQGEKTDKGDGKSAEPVVIDFDGIDQRIVALPIDRANYVDLQAAAGGSCCSSARPGGARRTRTTSTPRRRAPAARRLALRPEEAQDRAVPRQDRRGGRWATFIVTATARRSSTRRTRSGSSSAPTSRAEGRATARSKTRRAGGVGRPARRVAADLPRGLAHRARLPLRPARPRARPRGGREALRAVARRHRGPRRSQRAARPRRSSNLVLGHVWCVGGDMPAAGATSAWACSAPTSPSSRGATASRASSRARTGTRSLRAPLTQPGVDVKEGDFLLAVNGQDVKGTDEVYRLFLGRAGKQTVITVGPKADGSGSRKVTVVPTGGESRAAPAHLDGGQPQEGRRRCRDGKVGYVYVPDTQFEGLRQLQPLLLLAGGQGRRRHRRALQSRRRTSPTTSSNILGLDAAMMGATTRDGRGQLRSRAGDLRAQGDDRQPDVRLGRRRAAVALQERAHRPARGRADVGRARSASAAIPRLIDGGDRDGAPRRAATARRASGRSRTTASRPTSRSSRIRR